MKKLISLLSSASILALSVPFMTTAAEYSKAPDFENTSEYYSSIADGIKKGEYFGDFNGDGKFDPVDGFIIMNYVTDSSLSDTLNWDDKIGNTAVNDDLSEYCINNYETADIDGTLYVSYPLSSEMIKAIEEYGDINGDGKADISDVSIYLCSYYYGFEVGDLNMDNKIDSSDASCVLGYYAEQSTGGGSANEISAVSILGDVDENGSVDAGDASLILSMYKTVMTS